MDGVTKGFFGLGLKKFISLGVAMMLFFVVMKTVFSKYQVPGVSAVVKSA